MSSISETRLKSVVHWVEHPNFWILCNPEDITYIEVEDHFNKSIIDDIDTLNLPLPLPAIVPMIAEKYELTQTEVTTVIEYLGQTGMLVGTKPPLPPKRKWTPLDLLYMRFSLINPDTWLSNNVKYLEWIWTRTTGYLLLSLLVFAAILAIDRHADIIKTGQLILAQGNGVIIPFILLTCLVVSLHELAHAFTLKHYKRSVLDMGIFLMLLIPACYTNTSDSYPLRRHQQVLVVGAGIICQVVMAAIGLLLWHVSDPSAGIHTIAYLLMVTGLVTLAINLNPLSGGFDGYHLAVALTGINNLRSRSRLFYLQLLKRHPLDEEDKHVRRILAIYAPLSLAYIIFVFTFLIWAISSWTWLNLPAIAFTLFILWAIYFFAPTPDFKFMNKSSSSAESQSDKSAATSTSPQSIDIPQFLPAQKRKFPILWVSLALLGGAMFLPFPHQIGGKTELKTLRSLRSFVRNEQSMPCTVKQVFVRLGDEVKEGDNLVELSCRILDESIVTTKKELSQAQQSLADLQIKAINVQAESQKKKSDSQLALNEAIRSNRQDGETAQSQLAKMEMEKERLQVILNSAKVEYDRFLSLSVEGAVAGRDRDLATRAYETAKKDIEVKELDILTFQNQLRDQEERTRDVAESKVSEADRTNVIYEANLEASTRLTGTINNLENRLKELEGQQKKLILKSKQDGTVYSKDNIELDILIGKELLASDKPIIEIARTNQLVARVQIDHRDTEFVKKNAKVQFRPDQAKHRIYEGIIEREAVNKEPDSSINQSNLTEVDIVIYNDNPDNPKLAPNATGYAKIGSENMLVFQRIQLEFMRLVDSRFL
jgi:multidrug efflux pump subunit AcrA (membrane-fusion protein)